MILGLETTDQLLSKVEVRPLDDAYVEQWSATQRQLSYPDISKLRAQHHKMARLLAEGTRATDVARLCGVTVNTIARLRDSSAFQQLELHYATQWEESHDEIHERVHTIALQILDQLQDKLESAQEMEDATFKEIATSLNGVLDRLGYSPVKRIEERRVHLHATAEMIERIKGGGSSFLGERDVQGSDYRESRLGSGEGERTLVYEAETVSPAEEGKEV